MPQFSKQDNRGNPFQQGRDCTPQFSPEDIRENKAVCALSYLGILFFLPLVVCPKSDFGRFHANQALILLIVDVALTSVNRLFHYIPLVGWLVSLGVGLVTFGLMVWGLVNAAQGYARELPLVGQFRLIR